MELHDVSLRVLPKMSKQCGVFVADVDKHTSNQNGFGNLSGAAWSGLKRFVRVGREAIQIQAVVPVGATNERQTVWTAMCDHMFKRAVQVFKQWGGTTE